MSLEQSLESFINGFLQNAHSHPVIIGVSGPQGCGKTTACQNIASRNPNDIKLLSLDDFYLKKEDLQSLHNEKNSIFYEKRGHPGSHDLALLRHVLTQATLSSASVKVPQYDKSLNFGLGDRIDKEITVDFSRCKVVLLEGWMIGFTSLSQSELIKAYNSCDNAKYFHFSEIALVNEHLRGYEPLWDMLTCIYVVKAAQVSDIYQWRLQQEKTTALQSGRKVMDDSQVIKYVEKFIPFYQMLGIPKEKTTSTVVMLHDRSLHYASK